MRVIAGKARRLPLKTIEGFDTRPTTDRIKETLFNMLQNDIPGCSFLDLFAGSGGIGIEALSRDASYCCFVEMAPKAAACIRDNLKFTKLETNADVLVLSALAAIGRLEQAGKTFDIIFMDPPYNKNHEKEVLTALADSPCIHEETIIITEASLETDFSYLSDLGYDIIRQKIYKTNQHIFVQKRS